MTAAPAWIRLTVVSAVVVLAAAAFFLVRELSSGSAENVDGSGVAATGVRHLPPFDGVTLAAANNVTIHVGGAQRVVVRGDDNLLPLVTTAVKGDQLVVDAKRGFKTTQPMRVDITTRALDTITLAGSGIIRAVGSVPHVTATLAGTGDLQLAALRSRTVLAVLAGSGRISVTATESLNAVLAGAGAIFYGGNPAHVTTNVTGAGTVTPR